MRTPLAFHSKIHTSCVDNNILMGRNPGKPKMSTATKKAKGRRLQDEVRSAFRKLGKLHGLQDDDIKSAIMGSTGLDLVLSPAARAIYDVSVECKYRETGAPLSFFIDHFRKYHFTIHPNGHYTRDWNGNTSLKMLVYYKNRMPEGPLVIMRFHDLISLLEKAGGKPLAQPFLKSEEEKDEEKA